MPMIFQTESAMRQRAIDDKKKADADAKDALEKMADLENQINNLKKDKKKAEELSIRAMAARHTIVDYLNDEKKKVHALQQDIEILKQKNAEAEADRLEFQNKHDEMFNSVSALNQRIEELESHKLHLLSKLKGYGDKGGLDYIVKTQKLDQIESKQFESRVVVERYDP